MLGVQRHVTAALAIAVAMVLAAGCGAGSSDVALTGADGSAGDGASTTVVPGASTAPTVVDESTSTVADDASAVGERSGPGGTDPSSLASGGAAGRSSGGPTSTAPTSTAPNSTGSTSDPKSTGDLDDALLRQIDTAVEHEDICGVYSALARVRLTAGSNARLLAQLIRIRDVMVSAAGFAPDDLSDDWATVTDGTSDMVDSLQQQGDAKRSTESHYDDGDYRSASQRVETWMERNCA